MEPVFKQLDDGDIHRIAKQWFFVEQVVAESYNGAKLDQSLNDLVYIQHILDDQLFSSNQKWELQSLGIVFGRVLSKNVPGLDWWVITDEFGTDSTLRYKDTSICINAITMISKRFEKKENVNVQQLYELVIQHLQDMIDNGFK